MMMSKDLENLIKAYLENGGTAENLTKEFTNAVNGVEKARAAEKNKEAERANQVAKYLLNLKKVCGDKLNNGSYDISFATAALVLYIDYKVKITNDRATTEVDLQKLYTAVENFLDMTLNVFIDVADSSNKQKKENIKKVKEIFRDKDRDKILDFFNIMEL